MKTKIDEIKATLSWNWHWIVVAVAVIVAFFIFVPAKPNYLPKELTGVWTSSDPRYADRTFELTTLTMAFGTGKHNVNVYFVSDVKETVQGNKTLYTVYCHHIGGSEEKISFYLIMGDGDQITFKNQQHIKWMKTKSET